MADNGKNGQLTFDFGTDFESVNSTPELEEEDLQVEQEEIPGLVDPDEDEDKQIAEFMWEERVSSAEDPAVSFVSDEQNVPETPAAEVEESVPEETEKVPAVENGTAVEETVMETESSVAAEEIIIVKEAAQKKITLNRQNLKRAALAFLASLKPAGAALDVITRNQRYRADAAAFWLAAANRKSSSVNRTALVEVRTESETVLEYSGKTEQLNLLRLARLKKESLEEEIRRTEPDLKERTTLFSEFEQWNYSASRNSAYRECLRQIELLERALYKGSRSERIRSANAASELYLVVPENSIDPAVVADGWGVVFVDSRLRFRLVKEAECRDCSRENMDRLALNIAAASLEHVYFANGIFCGGNDSEPVVGPLPRKRRRSC